MDKKIKKMLAVTIATTMVLSACGSSDSSSTASSSSSSDSSSATVEDDDSIFTANGTYPIVKEGEEYTVSVFAALRSYQTSYETEDNILTAWFEETTGVTIEWITCASADRETKLNTLMTSGSYPDVILDSYWSASEQIMYGEQGVIIPLNDLIDEYGPNMSAAFSSNEISWNYITMEDGNIYSLATVGGAVHSTASNKMWINQVWLDNLGLDTPTTTEELEAVLIAFRDEDANGNGDPNDEVPLSGCLYGWNTDTFKDLMNSFVYYDGTDMYVDDGTVIYAKTTDAWYDGLEWFSGLSNQGLTDPLMFTQTSDEYKALVDNPNGNVVGLVAGGYISAAMSIVDSERYTEYVALEPLEGPDGVQYAIYSPNYGLYGLSITDTCEYPEVVIRMWDLMYTEEGFLFNIDGEYGVDYVDAEEGVLNYVGEQARFTRVSATQDMDGQCWNQLGVWYRWDGYELDFSTYDGDGEAILYNSTLDLYLPHIPDLDQIIPSDLTFDTDASRTIVDIVTSLDTAVDAYTAQFAMGTLDLASNWDTYLAELEKLGLSEYIAAYQDAIDSYYN